MVELLEVQKPDSCAVEKLFFQRNISTAIAVGQARGVVMLAIAEAGLEVGEYTPNEVKQAVTGYGSAQKRQVQEMVRTLLVLPEIPRPDDAADALAIAITHLNTRRD
jgi:crossover junction endodeoxyribonuclease RuvC